MLALVQSWDHEIMIINESIILKFNYSDSLQWIWTQTLVSNSKHSKYVCFIRLLIQIFRFIKIFIILLNDSSDSNHLSKFVVLVVPLKKNGKKKAKPASKSNAQSSTEYCNFHVWITHIFDSCKCRFMDRRNQQHYVYC